MSGDDLRIVSHIAKGAEIVAEISHPDTFHSGHEGTGWERVPARPEDA